MKVIICGAGQVGTSIAKQLILEDNDVTVIDQSEKLINKIKDSLDVGIINGYASHPNVLEEAGAENADMIIAVTQSDEINMVACQVAHSLYAIPRKIARIRSQNYFTQGMERMFSPEDMPIDVIISPEVEVAKAIFEKLHVPGAIETIAFADNKVKLISVKLSDDSIINNLTIKQANERISHLKANIIGYNREQDFISKESDLNICSKDEVYVISTVEDIKELMGIFGHQDKEASKIRIVGGGRVGLYLAHKIEQEEHHHNVKLIESDTNRANLIAEKLQYTTIINGDALDREILHEVNISSSDTIIAISNDDEVNILSALLAKKFGCKKAISLVNSISFAPLFSSLGIDVIVNPREITVSSILQYIKNFKVRNAHSICESQAEIIETDAFESSYSVGKTIEDLNLPEGLYICMIVREDNQIIIPKGDTEIVANDRLIIMSRLETLKKAEKIFSDKYKYF